MSNQRLVFVLFRYICSVVANLFCLFVRDHKNHSWTLFETVDTHTRSPERENEFYFL